MNVVRNSVRQPVTVMVGVILVVLAGVLALQRVPIQLTPDVEDTIVAVTTRWEGASPLEIEQEIVDPQEERLQGLANLKAVTSVCQQGVGIVRLEFTVGTSKDAALREVSDKLRQVPSYPEGTDEPVVEASVGHSYTYVIRHATALASLFAATPILDGVTDMRSRPASGQPPVLSKPEVSSTTDSAEGTFGARPTS